MNTLLNRTFLKPALLLSLILVPTLALAGGHSVRGGGRSIHNDWHGPAHVVRSRGGLYSGLGWGLGLGIGYGIGYNAFGPRYYGYPYGDYYYPPREVIVEHNTYIEQPDSAPNPRPRSETSLLRDLQGHCYQRTFDQNGNELRTELDPSECNF